MSLRIDALRIQQPSGRDVYAFAATADQIIAMAEVPRIGRNAANDLKGFQRPEVMTHILEIRRYLNTEDAVLPNTIVVAFNENVRFEVANSANGISHYGQLIIPSPEPDQANPAKPGFVVDGQQRLTAIASCRHTNFPVFVTALIVPDIAEQRRQFVLVNRTKPLPQGLIYELLPEIDGYLPEPLARQRLGAAITTRLNLDPESALYRMIKTPTCPVGVIKDNSIRKMVLNSLSDGALFSLYVERRDSEEGLREMIKLLSIYWEAVRQVFPAAWGLPPDHSRLMHGVGIVTMGFVMDHLYARKGKDQEWTLELATRLLQQIAPACAWTQGTWPFKDIAPRTWNELQNTDRDIRILTNHFRSVLTETEMRTADNRIA